MSPKSIVSVAGVSSDGEAKIGVKVGLLDATYAYIIILEKFVQNYIFLVYSFCIPLHRSELVETSCFTLLPPSRQGHRAASWLGPAPRGI